MYQLCKGVAYCHGHGILHRLLTPFPCFLSFLSHLQMCEYIYIYVRILKVESKSMFIKGLEASQSLDGPENNDA